MVRFPLKQEILLLTEKSIFIGTVIYAGHESLTVTGLRKREYNECGFSEIEIAEKVQLSRDKILGYSKLEEEAEMNTYYGENKIKEVNVTHLEDFRENR